MVHSHQEEVQESCGLCQLALCKRPAVGGLLSMASGNDSNELHLGEALDAVQSGWEEVQGSCSICQIAQSSRPKVDGVGSVASPCDRDKAQQGAALHAVHTGGGQVSDRSLSYSCL